MMISSTGEFIIMFKKIVFAAVAAITIIAATSSKVEAQVIYGGMCCDVDPYGNPRYRCAMAVVAPVGGPCVCPYIAGTGFVCR